MHDLRIDLARLRADIDALAAIGRTPSGGLRRLAFTEEFEEARGWLLERMAAAGLEARSDAAGNVIGRMGPAGASVMSGSHIDTVPDGGPLDGALGVLAALECARTIAEARAPLASALEVAAFADEEGRFIGCMGSRALAGRLSADQVFAAKDFEGTPLAQAMRRAGLEPERVAEAARRPDEVAAFVELHIEQGPILEHADIPIGVVHSIVGINQCDLRFAGEADHAGTTPMELRKDAFMGAAHYAAEARELVLEKGSSHARLTFGIVETKPQVANIVPYEARLRQELREASPEALDALAADTRRLAARVAERFGLAVEVDDVFRTVPTGLSPKVQAVIRESCEALGLASLAMSSGAGHDAQVMAAIAEAGMIFVPSKGGRSHRADEWTEWDAIERGANVLLQTLSRLASDPGAVAGTA